mgnify:CR=1 FL=1
MSIARNIYHPIYFFVVSQYVIHAKLLYSASQYIPDKLMIFPLTASTFYANDYAFPYT